MKRKDFNAICRASVILLYFIKSIHQNIWMLFRFPRQYEAQQFACIIIEQ